MSPDKDQKLEDEAQVPEDEEETAEGAEDELLDEGAAAAPARGGSGALVGIIVVFIVIVLVVFAWLQRQKQRDDEAKAREQQRQVLGTQLTSIQDNVREAQRKLEADIPDTDGAIEALNGAAEKMGYLAQQTLPTDPETANQFVDLQRQVQEAARALGEHNDQYQAAVQAAQQELKSAAEGEVRPLAGKIENLATAMYGDVDTPIRSGPSMTEEEEEPAEEAVTPTDEGEEQGAEGAAGAGEEDEPAAEGDEAQPTEDQETAPPAGESDEE